MPRPQPQTLPAQAPARALLFAPAGGVYLRGQFHQGGEALPVRTDAEEAMLRRKKAHSDPAQAAKDFRDKPAFGKGELKGDRKRGVAPEVVPSVGRAETPAYADKPVPQPRLASRPAGQVERQHLPAELGQHLSDEEISRLSSTSARRLIQTLNSMPPDEEYAQAARGGVAKRGWYARSHQALRGLFGEEAPRFAAVLAATSPNTAPPQNLKEALAVWEHYVSWREERQEAGLGLPTETEVRKKMVDWFGDPKAKARRGIMGSKDNNIARALAGDVDATGFDSLLSGHKVDSFRQNLLGDPNTVTGDLWMERLGNLPSKSLGKPAVAEYLANSVKLRRVAALINQRHGLTGQKDAWTPAEVQETTWAFMRALAEVGARSREEGNDPLDPIQALAALTHDDVAASSDFLTLLSNHDPHAAKARESLKRLGLGKELDRTLRAYAASQASPAVQARTPRGPAVPSDLAGPERDAAHAVARRAGQHTPSFTGPAGRGKYSRRGVDSLRSEAYNKVMNRNDRCSSQSPPAGRPLKARLAATGRKGRTGPPAGVTAPAPVAAPAGQDRPPRGAYASIAASPSVEQDLSFPEALERTRSSNHAAFKSIVRGVSQQLGLNGQIHSAVGDWEDGAENSLLQTIPHPAHPEAVRYAAAWYGLLGNQRAVLTFHPDPKGTDSLYTIDLKGVTDLGAVRDQLARAGVPFRTLVPGQKGTKVVVYDQDRKWRPAVSKFAGAHNAIVRESVGTGSYLGGATRSAARAAYRRVITAYEAKHAQAGGGGGTLREVGQAAGGHSLGDAAGRTAPSKLQAQGRRVKLGRTHAQAAQERDDPRQKVEIAALKAAWRFDPRRFEADPRTALAEAVQKDSPRLRSLMALYLGGIKGYQAHAPLVQEVLADPQALTPHLTAESLERHRRAILFQSHLEMGAHRRPSMGGNLIAPSLTDVLTSLRDKHADPSVQALAREVLGGDHEALMPALDAAEEAGYVTGNAHRQALLTGVKEALGNTHLQTPNLRPLGTGPAPLTNRQALEPQMRAGGQARVRGPAKMASVGARLKFSEGNVPSGSVSQEEGEIFRHHYFQKLPGLKSLLTIMADRHKGEDLGRLSASLLAGDHTALEPLIDAWQEHPHYQAVEGALPHDAGTVSNLQFLRDRVLANQGLGKHRLGKKSPRLKFSGVNAPPGGVIVRGLFYQGGHFIPSAQLEKATWDQYQTVEGRRAKLAKRGDGSYDFQAAQAVAGPPASSDSQPARLAKVFHARDLMPTEPEQSPPAGGGREPRTPRLQAAPRGQVRSHVEQPADPAKVAEVWREAAEAPPDPLASPLSGKHGPIHEQPALPTQLNPQQARQYISRLYNVARDFDSDVQGNRAGGMSPIDVLYKRHAIWHNILQAEAEYRNRKWDQGPGRRDFQSNAPIPYTPEEQHQIIQRRHDNRAIAELDSHGLIDNSRYGAGDTSLAEGHLHTLHRMHAVGGPWAGRAPVYSLDNLYDQIVSRDDRLYKTADPPAYNRLGGPARLLITGKTAPIDVDDTIQHIRDQGIPINPERARQAWAEARAFREQNP